MATLERRVAAMERKGDDAYVFPPLSPATLERLRRLKTGHCATDEQPLAATASGAEAIAKRGPSPKLGRATRALLKALRARRDVRAVTKAERESATRTRRRVTGQVERRLSNPDPQAAIAELIGVRRRAKSWLALNEPCTSMVFLVPGFFGFSSVGAVSYFEQVEQSLGRVLVWVCSKAAELVRGQDELRREISISPKYFKAYSALLASIR